MNKLNQFTATVFTGFVILLLVIGIRIRDYKLITAERGLGYLFGVIGFLMMVILLIYPFRKRIKGLEYVGSVKAWFRIHMILGIMGPVFILYHCNFQLGSFNSNVALFCMLIVSSSGIVGRYIYSKIHHGLYGHRASLLELRKVLEEQKKEVTSQLNIFPEIKDKLFEFTDQVIRPCDTLSESFQRFFVLRFRMMRMRHYIRNQTQQYFKKNNNANQAVIAEQRKMVKEMDYKIRKFMDETENVAQFGVYERLFALWHLFHIPLVYMLFFAAIIHIVAVHLY